MLIRSLAECPEIIAGDNTRLRELVHPKRDYQFSGRYSLAHAMLEVGEKSRKHKLSSSEVYYIISGEGEMHIDEEIAKIKAGDTVEIPPGSVQWVNSTGLRPLEFLCIVDPAWNPADEEVLG